MDERDCAGAAIAAHVGMRQMTAKAGVTDTRRLIEQDGTNISALSIEEMRDRAAHLRNCIGKSL